MHGWTTTAATRYVAAVLACGCLTMTPAMAPALGAQARRVAPRPTPLPRSELAVEDSGGVWRTWWRSGRAPARWAAPDTMLARVVRWTAVARGIETAEIRLAGRGEAWRTRAVLVRIDPRQVRLRVAQGSIATGGADRTWTIEDAPASALVAFNAGQFTGTSAWGWLVRDGVERLSPGRGPLAPAIVVDAAGAVSLVPSDSVEALRPAVRAGRVTQAFQSYPALLLGDGEVPRALRSVGPHVDVAHRDARLGFGVLRDGRVLVALTRFDALGGAMERIPFGLTTPEMAALMGALGCTRAVALDGGISAQLRVGEREWAGMRRVPVGMTVEAR
jgi:hypothetical protein